MCQKIRFLFLKFSNILTNLNINRCQQGKGMMPDLTSRFTCKEKQILYKFI
jgi:hypothetical protein